MRFFFVSTQKANVIFGCCLLLVVCAVARVQAQTPAPVENRVFSSSVNVLILALDEADINSVRPGNLIDKPGMRPATSRPGRAQADQPPVPLNWSQPIRPPQSVEGLPATPAAVAPASTLREMSVIWLARAQVGGVSRAIPELPGTITADLEVPASRPPGRAQSAAAPLRRALVEGGIRDVMVTSLDGPTMVRSINAGRVDVRIVDRLRFATQQMLKQVGVLADELKPESLQAREDAIRHAARIGLAMGYRGVVVLAISPRDEYSYLLVDAARGSGEAFSWKPEGSIGVERDQQVTAQAASTLLGRVNQWPIFTPSEQATQLSNHMAAVRDALERGDKEAAKDHLSYAIALDPNSVEANIMLGDVMQNSNPKAAAAAYQRAIEINTQNGEAWARMAVLYTLGTPPDWVRSLQAAGRAISLDYDSANLRTAMAAAEFGRAEMFRRNGRLDQAEDSEKLANNHLDRARELAPNDPDVVAGISRLMAKYLLEQKRYKDAVQALELLAAQYPNDLETQKMYAESLEGLGRREEDLFAAWARVWKLSGESEIALDGVRYARITDGFDQRIFSLARNIFQMTSGVATGALPRETALLQAERSRDEMKAIVAALQLIRPPATRSVSDAHVSRMFAADLMQQAAEFYILYLETGSDLNRSRGVEMHRSAIESLNMARGGGTGPGL